MRRWGVAACLLNFSLWGCGAATDGGAGDASEADGHYLDGRSPDGTLHREGGGSADGAANDSESSGDVGNEDPWKCTSSPYSFAPVPFVVELIRFSGRRTEQVCSWSPNHGKRSKEAHRGV